MALASVPVPPLPRDIEAIAGTRLALGGHNPFRLDQPEAGWPKLAWVVLSGHVELFTVPLRGDRPAGARTHLMRVGAVELLLSLPTQDQGTDTATGILAVGALDTEVLAFDRRELEQLDPEHLAHLVDRWIAMLTAATAPATTGWADRIAPDEGTVELRASERLFGHPRRTAWLLPRNGPVHIFDDETAWAPADGRLPLVGPAWVQTSADWVELSAASTAGIISERALWPAIDRFHGVACALLVRRERERDDMMGRRLVRYRDTLANSGRGAYSRLAALLEPRHRPVLAVADDEPPILAASRLVANAMGVTVAAPREGLTADDNATSLAHIAAASHLHFRWIVLGESWWRGDHGPMIGFRGNSLTPVAILPRGARAYVLDDPTDQHRHKITPSVAAELGHQAVMLYQPLPDVPMTVPGLVRFGMRGSRLDLAQVVLMGLAVSLLGLVVPVLTGHLFSEIIPGTERGELVHMAIGLVGIAFGATAFQAAQAVALLRFEGRLDWRLQSAVIDRLLGLPTPFFRNFTSGDLTDRALGLQAVRAVLTGTTLTAILSSVFSLVSFGLLLVYSVRLSVVAAALVGVNLVVTIGLSYARLRQERMQLENQGLVDGLVVQFLIGVAKLRVAATELRALAMWARLFAAQKERFVAGRRFGNLLASFEAAFPVIAIVVLFAVASEILSNATQPAPSSPGGTLGSPPLDTGGFLAFNAAFGQLMAAMTGLATALTKALTVLPLFERSRPILTTPPERAMGRNHPGELSGEIELSQVVFRYGADGPPTLDSLSLRIEPGKFVAIVGPSGSGKSTLFRLLLGFEQPESGEVLFDGKPLSRLDTAAVRRQIGVVLQNGRITSGSIFTNIVGTAKLSEGDAWAAARMAGLDRDIEAMPMGMHTVMMEGAGTLSGGQRQRLMVARALVRKPRILLLDEATSALDNRTQAIVTESLAALSTTRIVIAHRLSTIVGVDRIFVMEAGRLVQSGSYEELKAAPGPFAELARRQMV